MTETSMGEQKTPEPVQKEKEPTKRVQTSELLAEMNNAPDEKIINQVAIELLKRGLDRTKVLVAMAEALNNIGEAKLATELFVKSMEISTQTENIGLIINQLDDIRLSLINIRRNIGKSSGNF
ncbi:MAG: hypothetical protein A2383_02820 [Candidatus Pacebacteria bacterium RIFOXYB1_FULL_39_46]|nr:MAG: hypothetical protein A2383_02820 [Candidatus Pacebacteria bacterium RIFOXYB1_FULL_39_46]OGJ39965.1 MAG: hypothetical protein A2582_01060 [Candidatus Pacebacteria bacterium RIFOXYD1_FULL_39_27]OGJ40772.1 MAG: hypothetical protein A2411_00635 [Candidatus Pacebacteria bacterium RIFOXYC1_FULL_39_21]